MISRVQFGRKNLLIVARRFKNRKTVFGTRTQRQTRSRRRCLYYRHRLRSCLYYYRCSSVSLLSVRSLLSVGRWSDTQEVTSPILLRFEGDFIHVEIAGAVWSQKSLDCG